VNPLDPAAIGAGSSPTDSGTATYTAALSGSTWTITGTGTMAAGVAGAGAISRSASQQVEVGTSGTAWEYLFSNAQSGCFTVSNNATISGPVYVRGNLCISNNAHLTGSPVQVEGTVTVGNNGSIGSAATPIALARLAGGCTGGAPDPHPCTVADRVHATTISQTTTGLTKPSIDLPAWYANAKPGPSHACTSGSVPGGFDNDATLNRSRATFNLTSGASYDCQYWSGGNLVGRLTWNSAASTLTVLGTIFFDGPIALSGNVTYSGRATIYSSSTISSSNNTRLCGVAACDATWNPASALIVMVAGHPTTSPSFTLANNSHYQGAVYAVTGYRANNNAQNWGPVIAESISIANNAGAMLPIGSVPAGAPGFDEMIRPVGGTWRG
jgi:hypothetical protein